MFKFLSAIVVGLAMLLSGCATPLAPSQSTGVVYNLRYIPVPAPPSGLGLIGGGVVGGVVGNQIGKGNGRKAATVLGVLGGAVAGNAIEAATAQYVRGVDMQVLLDSGEMVSMIQPDQNFRTGTRVRLSLFNGKWTASNQY